MIDQLAATIFAFWAALDPAYARAAHAQAIANVIAEEIDPEATGIRPPTYATAIDDLGAVALFAVMESSLDPSAHGDCRDRSDPTTCLAHGAWQLHGECGTRSLREQVRCWMTMLRTSPCEQHPIATFWGVCSGASPLGRVERLAEQRERKIAAALAKITLPTVDEHLAPERLVRPKTQLSHAVVLQAREWLKDAIDLPLGSEKRVEVAGVPWALLLEPHWHPEGFQGAPTGWHKGVSVYEARPRIVVRLHP